jgi:hypothetical protein
MNNDENKRSNFDQAMDDIFERLEKYDPETRSYVFSTALTKFFDKIKPKNPMPKTTGQTLTIKDGKLVERKSE